MIGTTQAALLVGVSVGLALGGFLADSFGLRVPFYAVGASASVAAIYAYLRLPETRHAGATGQLEPRAARPRLRQVAAGLLRSRDFAAISVVTFAVFLTRTAGRQTLVPLLAASRFGMSVGTLSGIFTMMSAINVVLITPAAIMSDRLGRKAVIVLSGAVMLLALVLYGQANSVAIFILASVVLALGSALVGPAPAAYVADIAPADARGLAMGLHRTTGDLGFVIGPPLFGWLADSTSFS